MPESARCSGSAVRTFGLTHSGRSIQKASNRPAATAMNARVICASAGDSSRPTAATVSALRFGMDDRIGKLHFAGTDHLHRGERGDDQVAD